MNRNRRPKVGKSKITVENVGDAQRKHVGFEWGLYFWKLPDGHLLGDGEGNMFNIPSIKGDIGQQAKLRAEAAALGYPDGKPWFYAGANRATDEEYQEQLDRLDQGLIPSLNDIGAVAAAKKSLELYGDAD